MTISTPTRGYDDSRYLKEMADGIIVRRFSSMEEAAKTVLGEESGSNVDRLRRKFREQNWYERGLSDYVDAEINRRAAEAPVDSEDPAKVAETNSANSKSRLQRAWGSVGIAFTPTATLAAYGFLVWVLLLAIQLDVINADYFVFPAFVVAVVGLALWNWKLGQIQRPKLAIRYLAPLAAVFGATIVFFWCATPEPFYSVGSAPGEITLMIAWFTFGMYGWSALRTHATNIGRRESAEYKALDVIAAIAAFGWLVPFSISCQSISAASEMSIHKSFAISGDLADIQLRNPGLDPNVVDELRKKIWAYRPAEHRNWWKVSP
jgi:hypothetical protein